MKLLLSILLTLLLLPSAWSQKGWRDHEMEVRVRFNDPAEARILHALHLSGEIRSMAGYALLYVIPQELEQLKQTGLRTEILKTNLNEYYKDFWTRGADQYHSYEQIIALMDSLSTAFPDICRKTLLGTTPQGRQIACLEISDSVGIHENEPEIIFDGGIHGDEIGGPENLIRFARYLCTGYTTDPEITELVNSREICIYPMVNPDGRANMSRYNSNYVDCNRDWGYMWDAEGNSPAAFSQPETRTIRDYILNHRFVIHITYHSGEEAVLYPWCYRSAQAKDFAALSHLAILYSGSSGYPNLQYRQSYADYPTNGETIDYSYGAAGTDALTMEISINKQPPASQIQYYYQANLPSMIAMIRNSGYGIEGRVTDSLTGLPVKAAVFAGILFPVYTDTVLGDYHKYLMPGTYTLKVVADNYLTKTISNVTVGSDSSTVVNINMQPTLGNYAARITAVVIPGNNPQDEANTPATIGAPDSINYSVGKNGWIVVDMQNTVNDIPGEDFTVYEGDNTPEGFTCYAGQSMDGPWIFLGTGMGTTSFGLEGAGLDSTRFIKIADDGDGQQNVANAGFDLDAVESLEEPTGITNIDAASLRIFPNPAHGFIRIESVNTKGTGLVMICDPQGKALITKSLENGHLTVDISRLGNGIYFVKLSNDRISQVQRLIKF